MSEKSENHGVFFKEATCSPSQTHIHKQYGFLQLGQEMGVSKNRGIYPKMDGDYNGKPYEQMDDLIWGGKNPETPKSRIGIFQNYHRGCERIPWRSHGHS